MSERYVCHFSCGIASACATKLTIDKYGDAVSIINAFVAAEDDDNRRFLIDCERWLGRTITILRDEKYDADPVKVWLKKRFLVSRFGAPCSKALKRDVLEAFHKPDDVIVLGYTADARDVDRWNRYQDANTGHAIAPLIDAGVTRDDCFAMVRAAGIEFPRAYRLGFKNANCLGKCPKGGMGYWNHSRRVTPEAFEEVARVQDILGPGSYFFRDRATGERISLRMLDPNAGRFDEEPSFECGAACEMQTSFEFGDAA